MSFMIRKLIAKQVAEITSKPENVVFPLVTPIARGKKNESLRIGLNVADLESQDGHGRGARRGNQRDHRNHRNEQAWQLAKKIVCPDHVHNVDVENGVVRFTLDPQHVIKGVLRDVAEHQSRYGFQSASIEQDRLNVIVEYSSPNIAKPFHAGHLRSTLIGNFLANLQESLGHHVTRINYLGDWGTQFGLLCVGFREFGSEEELVRDPIRHLYEVYVATNRAAEGDPSVWARARELFRKMEEGDKEVLQLRQRFRDFSISEYEEIYQRLGIRFDEFCSEAQYSEEAQTLLSHLRHRGLLDTSERGTSDVHIADVCPRFPVATLAKSDGASLYLTRDVSAALDRHSRYSFDRMLYVVDKGQEAHFEQLKGVLSRMGEECGERIQHVKFGKVLDMQTRKGSAIFLTDILEEAKGRMLDNMQQASTTKHLEDPDRVAEVLGISAIILQDLKGSLLSDYTFDWDRILTSQGDTGVFLQYCHARLCSIEEMNNLHSSPPPLSLAEEGFDTGLLSEPEAVSLCWHLSHFDVAVARAAAELQPKSVTQYLLQLGHLISRANNTLRVRGSPDKVKEARLHLFSSARKTLSNGMRLLGMEPLTKM